MLGHHEQRHQVIVLPLTSTGIGKAPPWVCQRCLAAIVVPAGHLQDLRVAAMVQGVVWIKERESKHNLQVVRMGAAGTVTAMERAIEAGHSVLIENMGESIDAVLNPVITRSTFKKVWAAAVQQACRGDPTASALASTHVKPAPCATQQPHFAASQPGTSAACRCSLMSPYMQSCRATAYLQV